MENKIGELNIKGGIVRIFLFEKIVNRNFQKFWHKINYYGNLKIGKL